MDANTTKLKALPGGKVSNTADQAPRKHPKPTTNGQRRQAREAAKSTAAKSAPKAKAVKTPKQPKARVEHISAAEFREKLADLMLTRNQAAQALGVSASRISEMTAVRADTEGLRVERLANRARWPELSGKLAKFAKSLPAAKAVKTEEAPE